MAETGSVTKAAAQLGLAQPALTAQLKRIERALGGALFERDRHGARPTPLGELVLERARVLLPAARGLQEEAARLANIGDAVARLRIGCTNGPILGGLVDRLEGAYPEAAVSTHVSWSTADLAERAMDGRLDYVLAGVCGDAWPAETELVWQVIAVDAVFVLLNERHPLAGAGEVELAELADARWAVVPGDGCFADCFANACSRAGFAPRTMYETDVAGLIDLVQVERAVALCQSTFRGSHGLVMVPIAGAPLRWRQLLGWHPDGPAANLSNQVMEHSRAAYADIVTRSPAYAAWLPHHPGFGLQHPTT